MAAQTELQSRWGIEWTSWPTRQCRRKQCSRSNSALVPGKHDIVQQCKGFTFKKPTPSLWKVFLIPSKPYQKLAVGGIRKVLTWRLRDWKVLEEQKCLFWILHWKKQLAIENRPNLQWHRTPSGLDIFSTFSYNDPPRDWMLLCWSIQLFLSYHFWCIEDAVKSGIAPTHLKRKNLLEIAWVCFRSPKLISEGQHHRIQNRKYPLQPENWA